MSFKVLYSTNALKDIGKLDPVIKKKIAKHIKRYLQSPFTYAHKLTDPKAGQYRWRAGNYRIVFDISGETVYVLKVKHRREIYKDI